MVFGPHGNGQLVPAPPPHEHNLPAAIPGPHPPNLTLNCPSTRSLLVSFPLLGMPPSHIPLSAEILPILQGLTQCHLLCIASDCLSVNPNVRIVFLSSALPADYDLDIIFYLGPTPALAIISLSVLISVQPCPAHPLLCASGSLPRGPT